MTAEREFRIMNHEIHERHETEGRFLSRVERVETCRKDVRWRISDDAAGIEEQYFAACDSR